MHNDAKEVCKNTYIKLVFDDESIELGCGRFTFWIESRLNRDPTLPRYNAALDVIESLILAHFTEGVDISSESYTAGVRTTLDAIRNNLDDE